MGMKGNLAALIVSASTGPSALNLPGSHGISFHLLLAAYGDGPKHKKKLTSETPYETKVIRYALSVPSRFVPVRQHRYPKAILSG